MAIFSAIRPGVAAPADFTGADALNGNRSETNVVATPRANVNSTVAFFAPGPITELDEVGGFEGDVREVYLPRVGDPNVTVQIQGTTYYVITTDHAVNFRLLGNQWNLTYTGADPDMPETPLEPSDPVDTGIPETPLEPGVLPMPGEDFELYSSLLPDVLIHAPERIDEIAIRAIRQTVIDLCTRANIWQKDYVGEIPVVDNPGPGWTFRRFNLPDLETIGGLIVDVRWIRIRGRTLSGRSIRALDKLRNFRDGYFDVDDRVEGDPEFFGLDLPENGMVSEVLLWPYLTNQSPERYEARFSLKPTHGGIGTPTKYLLEEYHEAIVDGAVSRLLRDGTETADYERAQVHRREYERQVRQSASRARGRFAGTAGTVRYGGIGSGRRSLTRRTGYGRRSW